MSSTENLSPTNKDTLKVLEERLDQLEDLYLTQNQQIDMLDANIHKIAVALEELCDIMKKVVNKNIK